MTKNIRIENADTSNWEVLVEVWDINSEGPTLVETVQLKYPTEMVTKYITGSRYLVIREKAIASKI